MLEFLRRLFSRKEKPVAVPTKQSISAEGLRLVKKHEGLRLQAYLPTPNDVWTIGYGHTKTAKKGMKITERGAEELLKGDIAWAEEAVRKRVKVPLNQNQFDALVSFVFNIGEGAFASSTLLRFLNEGKYQAAADQLPRWNRQKGNVLPGLTNRRQQERALFLK